MPWMKSEKVIAIRERAHQDGVFLKDGYGRPYVTRAKSEEYAEEYGIRAESVYDLLRDYSYRQAKYYPEGSPTRLHLEGKGPEPYPYFHGIPIEAYRLEDVLNRIS